MKADEFKKREVASVVFQLPADDAARTLLENSRGETLEFLMISDYTVVEGEARATVAATTHAECPRCRRSLPLVASGLCGRCEEVVVTLEPAAP